MLLLRQILFALILSVLPASLCQAASVHLAYSTFLTGPERLLPEAVALDRSGDAYVAGRTSSAFDLGFAEKLNPAGTHVLWFVTFPAWIDSLALDARGNAYLTGTTPYRTLTLLHPAQMDVGTGTKAVVIKLNGLGRVQYSTYLGGVGTGAGNDAGRSIAVTHSGQVLVGGETSSTDFPVTRHALLRTPHLCKGPVPGLPVPCMHGFLVRLNAAGNRILYATYIGGSGADTVTSVRISPDGGTLLSGRTTSKDFPVTQHLHDSLGSGGPGFVMRLNTAGKRVWVDRGLHHVGTLGGQWRGHIAVSDGPAAVILSSTGRLSREVRVGRGSAPWLTALTFDSAGNLYGTGYLESDSLHTVHAFQPYPAGSRDAFLVRIAHLRTVAFSTYLGGSGNDQGNAIAATASGWALVAGTTNSPDFPLRHALMPPPPQQTCGADLCSAGFLVKSGT